MPPFAALAALSGLLAHSVLAEGLVESSVVHRGPPSVSDARRFPDLDTCVRECVFNDRFRQNLARERLAWPANRQGIWQDTADETEWLREVWIAAWNAARECESRNGWPPFAVPHLTRLRDLLGEEDYAAGRMPPAVPVWRFRELR